MKILRQTAAAAALAFAALSPAQAVSVGLELSLVIDISGSVSAAEYSLQANGYKAAFLNAGVQSAILAQSGGIAVNVIQFASNAVQSIGWTHLNSVASITNFANLIGSMARSGSVGASTDIEDGMSLSIGSFNDNGYEGQRRVIDVSGDGYQSSDPSCNGSAPYNIACAATQAQRNIAQAAGITINGLTIEGDMGANGLTTWYHTNVRTNDGFVETANGFSDFERAAITKIGREIGQPVPEPTGLALAGLGLMGLALARRRKA